MGSQSLLQVMNTSPNHQLPLALDLMAGQQLAEWINRCKAGNSSTGPEVEAFIRWANSGRRGDCPDAARPLFASPFTGHVSLVGNRLEIMGRGHRDVAIWCLVVLSRSGSLNRMRECPRCQRWFFAENLKSKFCSPACRSAHFAAHQGSERAALVNRRWRINEVHLPTVRDRINRLRSLHRPATKAEKQRLERAMKRQVALKKELRGIESKLEKE